MIHNNSSELACHAVLVSEQLCRGMKIVSCFTKDQSRRTELKIMVLKSEQSSCSPQFK